MWKVDFCVVDSVIVCVFDNCEDVMVFWVENDVFYKNLIVMLILDFLDSWSGGFVIFWGFGWWWLIWCFGYGS